MYYILNLLAICSTIKGMKSSLKTAKAPLGFRASPADRERVLAAAIVKTGGDLSKFVREAALREADRVLAEHESASLTPQMRDRFYALIQSDEPPAKALVQLFKSKSRNFRLID